MIDYKKTLRCRRFAEGQIGFYGNHFELMDGTISAVQEVPRSVLLE